MKIARALLFAYTVVALCCVYVCAQNVFPSQQVNQQFDVIWLSNINTGFQDFRWNVHASSRNRMYLTGYELFVIEVDTFSLNYTEQVRLQSYYVDAGIFNNTDGSLCVVGPSFSLNNTTPIKGYTVAVSYTNQQNSGVTSSSIQTLALNYAPYAVAVDATNTSAVIAYFVGWVPNADASTVSLSVIRTQVNPTATGNKFSFNQTVDVLTLSNDKYVGYTSNFKPWAFHSSNKSELIVVDPNTETIFNIALPPPSAPFNTIQPRSVSSPKLPSAALFSSSSNSLFIGSRGADFSMQGTIMEYNLTTMMVTNNVLTLAVNQSDPRALVLYDGYLFVGLHGGPYLLKISLTNFNVVGYVTLPYFLYNIQTATAQQEKIYFATLEAHGKIFRVNAYDFCDSPCSINGYCTDGACACLPGFTAVDDNPLICNPTPTKVIEYLTDTEKGTAITMGILWAVTVVIAAAGWALWHKAKRGNRRYDNL